MSASMSAPGIAPHRLGVCSWSLRPGSAGELVERVHASGLTHVQLALDPIRSGVAGWGEIETLNALRSGGIGVVSGMMCFAGEDYSTLETIRATGGVALDEHWKANLAAARANARLARRLGLPLVTFHAGFIPHERGRARALMLARLREIVDIFEDAGVRAGFETGQENAHTLVDALVELDRPGVGVNFDPANMILYGMGDPVEALRLVAPRVVQIHIKDALPTRSPGTWGTEVVAGSGAVDWRAFFGVLRETALGVDLVIEREAGEKRAPEVAKAAVLVRKMLGASRRRAGAAGSTARRAGNVRGTARKGGRG